jgi:hypothetical protein
MLRARSRPSSIATALVVSALTANAHGFCRATAEHWEDTLCASGGAELAWRGPCTALRPARWLDPRTDDRSLDELASALRAASDQWAAVPCTPRGIPSFRFVLGAESSRPTDEVMAGANESTVRFNDRWLGDALHRPRVIAVTVLTFDRASGDLLDADVELNRQSAENPVGFVFATGTPAWGEAHLPTVLLHELGHQMGLGHSAVEASVMSSQPPMGAERSTLHEDDRAGVCAVYPPGPSAVCVPGAPPTRSPPRACSAITPGSAPSWGARIATLALAFALVTNPRRRAR